MFYPFDNKEQKAGRFRPVKLVFTKWFIVQFVLKH